jgi:ABC-type transport system involved in multi-copper enzyme maturation permease subunit
VEAVEARPLASVPRAWEAIGAIARNTFREAVRDRVLYLLLAFALAIIVAARAVSLLTVGSEEKIVKDLGLSALSVFGLLTSVFVGVSLVFKEIEKRTVLTLLATPIRRWQFVTGKYAGLVLVLAANTAAMSAVLAATVFLQGSSPAGLLPAILLIFVELCLVAAFAILFSSYTNPMLASLGTVAVYVAGHLSFSFDLLKKRMTTGGAICDVLHAIVPNLDRLDVKAQVVHGAPLPAGYVGAAAAYGALYTLAVLVLACLVLERRDFK